MTPDGDPCVEHDLGQGMTSRFPTKGTSSGKSTSMAQGAHWGPTMTNGIAL